MPQRSDQQRADRLPELESDIPGYGRVKGTPPVAGCWPRSMATARTIPATSRASPTSPARAAAAVGFDGIFFEVHPRPSKARSDGPNSITTRTLARLWPQLLELDRIGRGGAP